MLILAPLPADWQANPEGEDPTMDGEPNKVKSFELIRNSAQGVICYREDMIFAPGRSGLMIMHPMPESARNLSNVVHKSDIMRNAISKLAEEKAYMIDYDKEEPAGLLWLKGGGISTTLNQFSTFTFVRRPTGRSSLADPLASDSLPKEPPFKGVVERPVADGHFVQSLFVCQVGEILVLEGGARLRVHKPGETEHRDLCMVAKQYPATQKDTPKLAS